jgi:hypothetical protein
MREQRIAMELTEIRIAGVTVKVPCVRVEGRAVIVQGGWLKLAAIQDEDYQEGELVADPERFVAGLRSCRDVRADIFTFSQKPTNPAPQFSYSYEWESVAAIPVASFSDWWTNFVSSDLRKDVRRAAKRGVVVRQVSFDDEFVKGIVDIYDETPVRQGRPFWHYKKGFEAVKHETGTYLERSDFLGAFVGEELIGFLKVVYVDRMARLLQIISKAAHQDKRPMNALIAKAVELCEQKHCSHLTYGKYRYDGLDSSLTAFKHRNGFQEILVPKYYVPLTIKGDLALRLQLQGGFKTLIPRPVRKSLVRARSVVYGFLSRPTAAQPSELAGPDRRGVKPLVESEPSRIDGHSG